MMFIRKAFFTLVLVVLFVVVLLAAVDNSDLVALKFLNWQSPVWPLSWWILMAFIFGALFGVVLNFYNNTVLRLDARQAGKVAVDRTRQLDQARAGMLGARDDYR